MSERRRPSGSGDRHRVSAWRSMRRAASSIRDRTTSAPLPMVTRRASMSNLSSGRTLFSLSASTVPSATRAFGNVTPSDESAAFSDFSFISSSEFSPVRQNGRRRRSSSELSGSTPTASRRRHRRRSSFRDRVRRMLHTRRGLDNTTELASEYVRLLTLPMHTHESDGRETIRLDRGGIMEFENFIREEERSGATRSSGRYDLRTRTPRRTSETIPLNIEVGRVSCSLYPPNRRDRRSNDTNRGRRTRRTQETRRRTLSTSSSSDDDINPGRRRKRVRRDNRPVFSDSESSFNATDTEDIALNGRRRKRVRRDRPVSSDSESSEIVTDPEDLALNTIMTRSRTRVLNEINNQESTFRVRNYLPPQLVSLRRNQLRSDAAQRNGIEHDDAFRNVLMSLTLSSFDAAFSEDERPTTPPVPSSPSSSEPESETNDSDLDKCSICFKRYRKQDIGTPSSCEHHFCLKCIRKWSNTSNTCPIDRSIFQQIFVRHTMNGEIVERITVHDRASLAAELNFQVLVPMEVRLHFERESDSSGGDYGFFPSRRRVSRDRRQNSTRLFCEECGLNELASPFVVCDYCHSGYHIACHRPPLPELPISEWVCRLCMGSRRELASTRLHADLALSPRNQSPAPHGSRRPQTARRGRPLAGRSTDRTRHSSERRPSSEQPNRRRRSNRSSSSAPRVRNTSATTSYALPTFSLFGDDTLDYVSDGMDDEIGEVAIVSRVRSYGTNRVAQKQLLTSSFPSANTTSDDNSGSNLLDSIIESQMLWHSKNVDITATDNGRLEVKLKGALDTERPNVKKETGSFREMPLYEKATAAGTSRPIQGSGNARYTTFGNANNTYNGDATGSNFTSFNPSTRPGYSNVLAESTPFRGTTPIRFRMNSPRPVARRPQQSVPRVPSPPLSGLLALDSPSRKSSSESPEVDLYDDIEQESVSLVEPVPAVEPKFASLEPPPEPPALLIGGDSTDDDDDDELIIDDAASKMYDPDEPNDSDSGSDVLEKTKSAAIIMPTFGPHLPLPAPPTLELDLDSSSSEEEEEARVDEIPVPHGNAVPETVVETIPMPDDDIPLPPSEPEVENAPMVTASVPKSPEEKIRYIKSFSIDSHFSSSDDDSDATTDSSKSSVDEIKKHVNKVDKVEEEAVTNEDRSQCDDSDEDNSEELINSTTDMMNDADETICSFNASMEGLNMLMERSLDTESVVASDVDTTLENEISDVVATKEDVEKTDDSQVVDDVKSTDKIKLNASDISSESTTSIQDESHETPIEVGEQNETGPSCSRRDSQSARYSLPAYDLDPVSEAETDDDARGRKTKRDKRRDENVKLTEGKRSKEVDEKRYKKTEKAEKSEKKRKPDEKEGRKQRKKKEKVTGKENRDRKSKKGSDTKKATTKRDNDHDPKPQSQSAKTADRSDKTKRTKRKEMERYDVRRVVNERPKRRKRDEFGRDISESRSRASRTISRSRSPLQRRNRAPLRRSYSQDERWSINWSPVRTQRRSRSRIRRSLSRTRNRNRLSNDRYRRSPSRSEEGPRKRKRTMTPETRKRRRDERVDRDEHVEHDEFLEEAHRHHRHRREHVRVEGPLQQTLTPPPPVEQFYADRTWSAGRPSYASVSPVRHSPTPMVYVPPRVYHSPEDGMLDASPPPAPENIKIIVANDAPKRRRKKKKEQRRKKRKQPAKEIFASGDNILVSVNFKDNHKVIECSSKKSERVKKKRSEEQSTSVPKRRKANPRISEDILNAKPVAVIDLNASPCREIDSTEVITLLDSGDEADSPAPAAPSAVERVDERGAGPKTPPEPSIKFAVQARVTAPPIAIFAQDDDEIHHKGPNTPPEPVRPSTDTIATTMYDPFEPTKSPSKSPEKRTSSPSAESSHGIVLIDMFAAEDEDKREQRAEKKDEEAKKDEVQVLDSPLQEKPSQDEGITRPDIGDHTPTLEEEPTTDRIVDGVNTLVLDLSSLGDEFVPKSSTPLVKTSHGKYEIQSTKPPDKPITVVISQQLQPTKPQPQQVVVTPTTRQLLPASTASKISLLSPQPNSSQPAASKHADMQPWKMPPLPPLGAPFKAHNGDDSDFAASPYSPASSEGDEIFEPPPLSPTKRTSLPLPPASYKPRLDSLFTSSPYTASPAAPSRSFPGPPSKKFVAKTKKPKKLVTSKRISTDGLRGTDEEQLKIIDEVPNSAVEMLVKEKYMKKLQRQERVVEEVKVFLKPHYASKHITKEQYKEILRKAVPKICHNKAGDINPRKIQGLVEAYVKRSMPSHHIKRKPDSSTSVDPPAFKESKFHRPHVVVHSPSDYCRSHKWFMPNQLQSKHYLF